MASLNDVITSIDDLKTAITTVDESVEAVYDKIKEFTGQGITSEVADQLLAKVQEARTALDKVTTDD